MSKAFDTIDHSILLDKLYYYGIRGQVLNLFSSYLTNLHHSVKYKNTFSIIMLNNKGVPQVSNVGPILFILYINDIDTAFNKNIINYNLTVYADDTALTISAFK